MKKYLVLGVLFLLPITAYLFFSSGVNNFAKLPVVTENVSELQGFTTLEGEAVMLDGKITILGFFGKDLKTRYGNVFNLTHKIYKPFHEFEDLQFVSVVETGSEPLVEELLIELERITDVSKWKFIFGSPEAISSLYESLDTNLYLDKNLGTPFVYIVDKNKSLRGRKEDKAKGLPYGYNTASVADLNNKMKDDVKVILAEYRLALKKYNSRREI